MTDDESPTVRRIADPAIAELTMNGRLLYQLEQRQESDLDELEMAATVVSLRSFASALEETNLDRPAEEILEESDHSFEHEDLDDVDGL